MPDYIPGPAQGFIDPEVSRYLSDELSRISDALKKCRGVITDPERATDTATDTFESAQNPRLPGTGNTITRDFQSANTTTTPTLDGRTITDIAGNALWAGALNRVHDLLDDGTNYRVVNPIRAFHDEDDMASDDPNGVASQQSVKAYADAGDLKRGTAVAASGTEVDFTGIRAGADLIIIPLDAVSSNGTDNLLIQIGDSGGFETSGYDSDSFNMDASVNAIVGSNSTAGFIVLMPAAGQALTGHILLTRISGNKWVASGKGGYLTTDDKVWVSDGVKELSAELDRVRITVTGSDSLDNGNVNVLEK